MGIVHRDLKPENIMVIVKLYQINLNASGNIDGVIKIIDFGFANYLSTIQRLQNEGKYEITSDLLVGTPNYIAP